MPENIPPETAKRLPIDESDMSDEAHAGASPSQAPSEPRASWWALAAAVALAILGFAPVGWLLGKSTRNAYLGSLAEWGNGVAICALGGFALALWTRRHDFRRALATRERIVRFWSRHPLAASAAFSVIGFAIYTVVALRVFDRKPLNIDEIAQLIHARVLTSGHLWAPVPAHPEFTSIYQMVDVNGKLYSQFPVGGPAALAIGVLFGAPWIVGPLFGALAVAAFASLTRATDLTPGEAFAATALFAASPFFMFLSGTMMNHVPTLAMLLVAVACLAHGARGERSRPGLAAVAGLGFGLAAMVRPGDAAVFAIPAGIWLAARAVRTPRLIPDAIAAAAGVSIPLSVLGWVNRATTGGVLRFGYEVLWGAAHNPGFHVDPSGTLHTPAAGLALLAHYAVLLQSHVFEAPLPALLPVVAGLALARSVGSLDRYLLACGGLLCALYGAYWFDGTYLGPRFLLPLSPILVLWVVRLPGLLKGRFGAGMAYRGTLFGYAVAGALAVGIGIPSRAKAYHHFALVNGWDVDSAAVAGSVRHSLVLVRESWGSQVVARMWAAGLSRADASWLFRRIDTCQLDQALSRLEREPRADSASIRTTLHALTADSARLVASPFSPLTQERFLPGATYAPSCLSRIADDRRGFTQLFRTFAADRAGNTYVRSLAGRDTLLLAAHPDLPLYLLAPADAASPLPLRFTPVARDSVYAAARMRPAGSIPVPTGR